MASHGDHFIQGAIKHPGALKKAAKTEGKTVQEYCAQGDLTAHRERQCNLAKTLGKMHKGK
jgi:hypothetical protein